MLHLQEKPQNTKNKEHIGPETQADVMYSIIQSVIHMKTPTVHICNGKWN